MQRSYSWPKGMKRRGSSDQDERYERFFERTKWFRIQFKGMEANEKLQLGYRHAS